MTTSAAAQALKPESGSPVVGKSTHTWKPAVEQSKSLLIISASLPPSLRNSPSYLRIHLRARDRVRLPKPRGLARLTCHGASPALIW